MFKNEILKIYWICNERPMHNYDPNYEYIEGIPEDFCGKQFHHSFG